MTFLNRLDLKVGTLSFYDESTDCIIVALPLLPYSVSIELIVANNICDLIGGVGREQVGLVSAMLRGGVEGIDGAWNAMRVDRGRGKKGAGGSQEGEKNRGVSGTPLVGADANLVEVGSLLTHTRARTHTHTHTNHTTTITRVVCLSHANFLFELFRVSNVTSPTTTSHSVLGAVEANENILSWRGSRGQE